MPYIYQFVIITGKIVSNSYYCQFRTQYQRIINRRMFEKIVQNIIGLNPTKQATQLNSQVHRNRDHSFQRSDLPDMKIRKVKSADSELPRLLVSTWETQSTYEMFDYQNKGVKTTEYRIDNSNDIYMANVDKRFVKCIVTKSSCPNDNAYCGTVQRVKGVHYFTPSTRLQSFKVIGSDSKQQCILQVGNLIRIGRMKYFIKQTFDGFDIKMKHFQRHEKAKELSIQSIKSGSCKFCLCDQHDNSNILISPCSCKGSCAQVHLQCLKQWLSNKVSRKSTSFVQFLNYDNFSCQICKQDLPTTIRIDGKLHNILNESSASKDPYIILEGIPNQKSSTKNNMTIKINFKQKKRIVLGRGHESDVRLQDVSISRQHCIMKFNNGLFCLNDNNSKFGTLIKLEPGHKVNLHQQKIQIGRMVLDVTKPQKQLAHHKLGSIEFSN